MKLGDLLAPKPPLYEPDEFEAAPLDERLKMVCQDWSVHGYGSPPSVYAFYVLKLLAYVWLWSVWMGFTDSAHSLSTIGEWWLTPIAFQKAVIWTVAFEGMGLASGSGPLTARYLPPFGGAVYFLRPGTLKVPLFPGARIVGRPTRSLLDSGLYVLHLGWLFWLLTRPTIEPELVIPTLLLLPILGVLDKTMFLAARSDHYYIVLVAYAFADWLPASKLVWAGIWFWAATSKLNRHFPGVIATMLSNAPTTGFGSIRRLLFRDPPEDLQPSTLSRLLAHGGTAVEYAFPLTLLFSSGGITTTVALVVMVAFHSVITSSIPLGVPIEWNLMMVYGGFFLFWENAGVWAFDIGSPVLAAALLVALVGVPLAGNLWPAKFSFLCSMRYYAGNWAYSIWLFRGDAAHRLDDCLVKPSKHLKRQLGVLYDDRVVRGLLPKVMAFRAMHVHGRALVELVPKAVSDIREYEWIDGELVAGMTVGWNFGDGHLHNEQLLRAIQDRCGYEPGELRVIFVESQPLGTPRMHWRIHDAATGPLDQGHVDVIAMSERQTWQPPGLRS